MKQLLFLFLVYYSGLHLQAQDRRDTTFIYAGIALRPDKFVPIELDMKFIQRKGFSAGFRMTKFDYVLMAGRVEVISKLTGVKNHVNFGYSINGFTLKPGWIPLKLLKPKTLLSFGVYGVLTHSTHDFFFEYSDVAGKTTEWHSHSLWNYGIEADFHLGFRFVKCFNVGFSVIYGLKQIDKDPVDDIVNGLHPYEKYTPTQGYNSGAPFYLNALLSIGGNF